MFSLSTIVICNTVSICHIVFAGIEVPWSGKVYKIEYALFSIQQLVLTLSVSNFLIFFLGFFLEHFLNTICNLILH